MLSQVLEITSTIRPGKQPAGSVNKERILVVGPSWIGDMIMAQSLFKLLQQRYPDCLLDVIAPQWSLPVIQRMPEVREGIVAHTAHGELGLGKRRQLGRALRHKRYNRAIVLPRSFKAALVPWLAKIPLRVGYRGEMRFGLLNDIREMDKQHLDQTVKRFVALGLNKGEYPDLLPQPALSVSQEHQREAVQRLDLDTDKPVVALMPGAEYGPAKCWPLPFFATLANLLDEAGFAVWVFGSKNDAAAGELIAARSPARNLCGSTSLEDVIDLLAACEHAVTNDSGLMHVAAAVGTRIHAIYGSSSEDFTPPLSAQCVTHNLRLECSPCFRRECPLGHLNCLNGISPQVVFAGVQRSN